MRYRDLETWAKGYFTGLRYNPMPVFDRGPGTDVILQKALAAQRVIFFSLGGGGALTTEGLFDTPFITTRCIGKQRDGDDAEQMAIDLDIGLLSFESNRYMGDALVLSINRSGGGPQLLMRGAGDRYHFTCSYVVETKREGIR